MLDVEKIVDVLKFGIVQCQNTQKAPKNVNFQVEIRLKKKVPKSIIEKRWQEVAEFIKEIASSARNWKPIAINPQNSVENEEIDTAGELEPFCAIHTLFEKVIFGSNQIADGEKLEKHDFDQFPTSSSQIHLYKLNTDGPLAQNIGDDDDSIVGSQHWQLPCQEFENIWENLIYDSNLKNEVMSYVYALVHLSEKHVNSKIISVNRLILLVGPPGTGKTSLCKGLAQHLAIRLNNRYTHSVLVEINSHSLFSKWFSESGKLVQKMFDQIDEVAEDSKTMVFVLIDEVESLGMCREGSSSRSEPADAIRAVNALLTQIDRIRRRDNVLILCTSNLEKSLDPALVDRADIVRNVGQPSVFALYAMLKACIVEMIRIGVVKVENSRDIPRDLESQDMMNMNSYTLELFEIAKEASGLSGRAISMLPTLVYSRSLEECLEMDECFELFREAVRERKSRNI